MLFGIFRSGHSYKSLDRSKTFVLAARAEAQRVEGAHRDKVGQALADRQAAIASIRDEMLLIETLR